MMFLSPDGQRAEQVRLLQAPRVPQWRRCQRPPGDLHLRQPRALRQGLQLRGGLPPPDRRGR